MDLTFPDSQDSWESYSRWLHSPGATSRGGRAQTRESRMVPWLLVLVLSRSVSRRQLVGHWLAAIRVGPDVQPMQGEIYTYSCILGHVHPYSSVTSIS